MTAHDEHRDFEKWAQTWQDDTHTPAAAEMIRDYVTRRGRLLHLFRLIEVAIGAVALPVVAYLAWIVDDRAGVNRDCRGDL